MALIFALANVAFLACETGEPAQPLLRLEGPAATPVGPSIAPSRALSPACEAACVRSVREGDDSDAWSTCYACKCVMELGPLPQPSELTCAKGELVPIYRVASHDGIRVKERVVGEEPTECANPAMLDSVPVAQACTPGVRLGQLATTTAIFKWVCRQREGLAADARDLYDDMGVIGHNPSTGATCFWVDHGGVDDRSDGVFPALDVSDGNAEKLAALRRVLGGYEGDRCVVCHDNDPFVLSPHVSALWRWDLNAYLKGPYAQVRVAADPTNIPHRHLVSQQAEPCTRCHRLSDGRSCKTWVANATGSLPRERPFQPELLDGGPELYPFVFWMPPTLPSTHGEWDVGYGKAVEHIRECCSAPDTVGCAWEPIPGFRTHVSSP